MPVLSLVFRGHDPKHQSRPERLLAAFSRPHSSSHASPDTRLCDAATICFVHWNDNLANKPVKAIRKPRLDGGVELKYVLRIAPPYFRLKLLNTVLFLFSGKLPQLRENLVQSCDNNIDILFLVLASFSE